MVFNEGFKGWDPFPDVTSAVRRLGEIALYVPRGPRIFPAFYERLLEISPIPLSRAPLERLSELGEPLAQGGEILDLPVTSSIVHSCDPSHLAATHILTVPLFFFDKARMGRVDVAKGEGSYLISLKRGIDLGGGWGIFPFTREVTMYLHGPLCFELDTGEVKIFFQLIPCGERRHVMEVTLYQEGSHGDLLDVFLPKIGEFFVKVSMAEDSFYLSKVGDIEIADEGGLEDLGLPGLRVYQTLFGDVLPQILTSSYEVAKGLIV